HLRQRTNTFASVTRVRDCLSQAIHRYFSRNQFLWVHTPIITSSDCEGAGEMFRVSTLDLMNVPKDESGQVDFDKDFFGKDSFLTVSGQINVEAFACALSRVYTFGPTFRAENSNTSRHLSEFWMIEPEIAFADLNDDADLAEDFLKAIFTDLLNERGDDMAFFQQRIDKGCIDRLENFVSASFERMEYTDAISALKKAQDGGKKFDFNVEWGCDLQSEHERWLTEDHIGRPVVLMNYPKDIKAFYMRLNDDEKTVAAMDVLAPGIGEIIGGAQREERLDVLDRRIADCNLDPEPYWWYRDLRKYGTVPHAGFGLGFERTILYATGMTNIRDVIPFFRAPRSCDF
ncbi:MAG: asparagine--tRNA ligase, partial [Phycisphaerales bacterium]|nr:asparagine--tRNA ligase [Phycisphaerales bacterium]